MMGLDVTSVDSFDETCFKKLPLLSEIDSYKLLVKQSDSQMMSK